MNGPFDIPFRSDVVPNMLSLDSNIKFRCHKAISCFNACCKQADITLTPYDIIRLKQRFEIDSGTFLKTYTLPFEMDADKVPGVKIKPDKSGACPFLREEGCSVYEDRPTSCRYYPLGHLAMKAKDAAADEENFVLIKEDYCKGHEEDHELSVKDYLQEQEIIMYKEMNRQWLQLILKKKSGGPTVGKPSEASLQLYFMMCFDIDRARRFVLSSAFSKSYDLPQTTYDTLENDDIALMRFGFQLMRQVLFGEITISEHEGVWEERLKARKEIWDARRQAEIARAQQAEDDKYKNDV